MATVIPLWGHTGLSGRPDRSSDIYIRRSRITGKSYAVRLRRPCRPDRFTNAQIRLNNRFGALNRGVAQWYRRITSPEASPEERAVLRKLQRLLRRQDKYSIVRGLVVARYATVNEALDSVTVTVGRYTATEHFRFDPRPLT